MQTQKTSSPSKKDSASKRRPSGPVPWRRSWSTGNPSKGTSKAILRIATADVLQDVQAARLRVDRGGRIADVAVDVREIAQRFAEVQLRTEIRRIGIGHVWIVVGSLVIIGLGMMGGIVKTRQKDPA